MQPPLLLQVRDKRRYYVNRPMHSMPEGLSFEVHGQRQDHKNDQKAYNLRETQEKVAEEGAIEICFEVGKAQKQTGRS